MSICMKSSWERRNSTTKIAWISVCQAAYCWVSSISSKKIKKICQSVSAGQKVVEHGNKGKRRSNTKSELAVAWYLNLIGDKMPYKKQIHIPSRETQKDIYHRYCEDMSRQGVKEEEKTFCACPFFTKCGNWTFHLWLFLK